LYSRWSKERRLEVAMWKAVLAGTTAVAIAGSSLVYAQKSSDDFQRTERWRPGAADIAAFGDARIAALHAGLKLTADQEKLWPPVEAALRDLAKQRSERFAARANADPPHGPIACLNHRAAVTGHRAAGVKKLADAAGPLYKSLDESQKHRFVMLARLGDREGWRGRRGHMWQHRGRDGGPMGGDRQPQ